MNKAPALRVSEDGRLSFYLQVWRIAKSNARRDASRGHMPDAECYIAARRYGTPYHAALSGMARYAVGHIIGIACHITSLYRLERHAIWQGDARYGFTHNATNAGDACHIAVLYFKYSAPYHMHMPGTACCIAVTNARLSAPDRRRRLRICRLSVRASPSVHAHAASGCLCRSRRQSRTRRRR